MGRAASDCSAGSLLGGGCGRHAGPDGAPAAPTLGRRQFLGGAAVAGALLAALPHASKGLGGGAGSALAPTVARASEASAEPVKGGTLYREITNPVAIDPFNVSENQGTAVTNLLFDALTMYDYQAGELTGLAAESWEGNADATQFTFHLRPGMTFHNGDPVVAQDFVRAWNRLCSPTTNPSSPSTVSSNISMVAGYEDAVKGDGELDLACPDDLTLVVNLSQPFADFPYVASMQCLSPVPAVAMDDFDAFFRAPIGNGPFQMDGAWVDSQYINLKRFDGYWGEKPLIDGVNFVIFKDVSAAYMEYQGGTIDITNIPSGQYDQLVSSVGEAPDGYTANPGAQCILGETVATYYLVLNCADDTLSDVRVRRAVSYAINRQSICDTVWMGTRRPAQGFVPPVVHGQEQCLWDECAYDPDKAAELLDEAGHKAGVDGMRGISLKLSFNAGGGHEDVMQMIQSDLRAVGIEAQLDGMEWAAYLDQMGAGSIQAGRMTWGGSYPTLDAYFYPVFYSTSESNYSQYRNEDVDAQIDAARQIVDDAKRVDAYAQADALIAADMPVVPIAYFCLSYVASARAHDLYIAPDDTSKLTKVWLEA